MLTRMVFLLFFLPFSYAQCQSGYYLDPAANKCFKVYTQSLNYFGAWKTCELDGGTLASIPNAFVNSFIGGLLSSETSYYIGLNKLSSDNWAWLDGSTVSYSNWNTGSGVTNNCASIQAITNKWIDQACQNALPFVCSTPPLQGQADPTCAAPQNITCKPACDEGWTIFDKTGYCYRTVTGVGTTFYNAEQICVTAGAHLVSIHSLEESDFVAGISATGIVALNWPQQNWIGLTRVNGNWTWTDGTPVDYRHPHSPDNSGQIWPSPGDCTYIFSDGNTDHPDHPEWNWRLTWDECTCSTAMRAFTCKKLPTQ